MLKMCPICRTYHNPDAGCADKAGSYLREMGFKRKKMSAEEEKEVGRQVNRILLGIFVLFVIILAIIIIFHH